MPEETAFFNPYSEKCGLGCVARHQSEVRRTACLALNANLVRWHSHWNLLLNEQLAPINRIAVLH